MSIPGKSSSAMSELIVQKKLLEKIQFARIFHARVEACIRDGLGNERHGFTYRIFSRNISRTPLEKLCVSGEAPDIIWYREEETRILSAMAREKKCGHRFLINMLEWPYVALLALTMILIVKSIARWKNGGRVIYQIDKDWMRDMCCHALIVGQHGCHLLHNKDESSTARRRF